MKSNRRLVGWLSAGAVLWVFLVLGLFYWVQKPLGWGQAASLGRSVLDLATAALIALAGLALGSWLLGRLRLSGLSDGDRIVLGTGLGLGLLGLAVFGLGLLGILSRWVFLPLLLMLLLLLRREVLNAGRTLRRLTRPGRGILLYVGTTLALALLGALTPPADFDGLFYHLTGPAWALAAGRVGQPQANLPHLHFPALMESLFLLAMALWSDVAAKLLHWGFTLLLGGLVYRLARRHVGAGCAWGSVLALYAIPMIAVLAGWAYNDLALAFFQVSALYAMLNGLEGHDRRWCGLAGLLAGLAMGLKYTSFVCPVALVVLMLWEWARRRWPIRELLGWVALFSVVSLVVASPWYLRNLAFTGNPVYPFAHTLFGGQGWDQWHADWYAQAGTGLGGDVGQILALPVTLTLGLRDMNYFDGRTGPLFLAALPALLVAGFLARRRPCRLGALLWFALAQYAVWVIGVVNSRSLFQSRLLLTALVALCPALAYVYETLRVLDRPSFSLQRFVGLALVLVLVFNVVCQVLDVVSLRPLSYLVGQESREGFLTRRLGAHYLAMRAVAQLPADARVQFLWEPRSYHSGRVVQPDPILETWKYLCEQHSCQIDLIARELQDRGVTHILLYESGMENIAREVPAHLTPGDLAAWEAFREAYLVVVWEQMGVYALYAWR